MKFETAVLVAVAVAVAATAVDGACVTRKVPVSTYADLAAAVGNARAGDIIQVAAGKYSVEKTAGIIANVSGRPDCPIRIVGAGADTTTIGYAPSGVEDSVAITIRASYWELSKFTVRATELGIFIDNTYGKGEPTDYNVIDGVSFKYVTGTGVRMMGNFNTVKGCSFLGVDRGVLMGSLKQDVEDHGNTVRNSEFVMSGSVAVVVDMTSYYGALVGCTFWEGEYTRGVSLVEIGGQYTTVVGNHFDCKMKDMWENFLHADAIGGNTFFQANTADGVDGYVLLVDNGVPLRACASNRLLGVDLPESSNIPLDPSC